MPSEAKDPDCIAICWSKYQDCIYYSCLGGVEWSDAELWCNTQRQECDNRCPPLFNPDGTPFNPKKA
jgi:hypothetical protein